MTGAGGERAQRSVYATLDGERWFSLPSAVATVAEDVEGVEVRGMLGQRRRLDPALAAAHEVTPEAGRELARIELLGLLGTAGRGLGALSGLLASRGKDPAALAPLHKVVGAVEQALRAPSEPPGAARAADLGDPQEALRERFEAWARRALEDPGEIERLRGMATDLQAAAEALKEAADTKRR
jgi:hypothetical protein